MVSTYETFKRMNFYLWATICFTWQIVGNVVAMTSFVLTRITIPSFTVYATIVLNSNRPVYWSVTSIQANKLFSKIL